MRILLLNQAFHPDTVSSGQHLTDLASHLASSGHVVTVITSNRSYDNPKIKFPRRELWQGIRIIRIPVLGSGKKSKLQRLLGFASFFLFCGVRLVFLGRHDITIALTSPPLISVLGILFAKLKGGRFVYWIMDLNPDEAIAAGWLRPESAWARLLERISVYSMRHAGSVIVLDRFMKQRLLRKGIGEDKLTIIPPWAHDSTVRFDPAQREEFRALHGLKERFVVMHSGNHSPCHPLDTLLQAALRLASRQEIVFCFIGGGSEYRKVQAFATGHDLGNFVFLPYQPLDKLAGSLSAADLQVVVMGEPFIGIVHPCKIYNILTVGVPFLYIGPPESHVTDIVGRYRLDGLANMAEHGAVEDVERHILRRLEAWRAGIPASGQRIGSSNYSQMAALTDFMKVLQPSPPV